MCRSRNEALDRLSAECRGRGANAVVGLRLDTSQLADGMAQVCAYGTAVYAVRVVGSDGDGNGNDEDRVASVGAGVRSARSLDLVGGRRR